MRVAGEDSGDRINRGLSTKDKENYRQTYRNFANYILMDSKNMIYILANDNPVVS